MWNGYCQFGVVEKTFSQTDRHTRCRSQIPNSLIHTRRLQCMHGFFLSSEIRWRQTRYIKNIIILLVDENKEWKNEREKKTAATTTITNLISLHHLTATIPFTLSVRCIVVIVIQRAEIGLCYGHTLIHSLTHTISNMIFKYTFQFLYVS